jgi:hypothetical protein
MRDAVPDLNSRQLRAVLAVAEYRSFVAAAANGRACRGTRWAGRSLRQRAAPHLERRAVCRAGR